MYLKTFDRTPHLRETKIDNHDTGYQHQHKTPDANRIDHTDINRNRDVSNNKSIAYIEKKYCSIRLID